MREGVLHDAGQDPPLGTGGRLRLPPSRSRTGLRSSRSTALPSCRPRGPCRRAGAAGWRRRREPGKRRRRGAPAAPPWRSCAAGSRRCRRACRHRRRTTGRCSNPGAAACRRSRPDPSPPGRNRRAASRATGPPRVHNRVRLAPGRGVAHRKETRHHALDIAVHYHRRPVERDRRDRGGGVGADPRQVGAAPPRPRERRRHARRPRPGRSDANCARARNSPGPANSHAARRPSGPPPPDLRCAASVRGSGVNTVRPWRPSSAAA